MEKVKILFIANKTETFGGGEISLLELVSRLDKSRFKPTVLCPGEGPLAERLQSSGIDVLVWEMPSAKTLNFARTFRKAQELKNIMEKAAPDIVHTNGSRAQFYASIAVKGTGARLIWHVRESIKDIPMYDHFLARSADAIICASEGVRIKRFGNKNPFLDKIKVIYNGVDVSAFVRDEGKGERFRQELGLSDEHFLLGTFGALVPLKGQDILIKSFAALAGKFPKIRLLIMGKAVDGAYTCRIKHMIWKKHLEKTVILKAPTDDIVSALSALNLFVLPSKREGFSRVLLEAMSCSLPIVATNVSGNDEAIVKGESGILVPYGDEQKLTAAIKEQLKDSAAAKKMGLKARERAGRFFNIEKHVNEVQDLYMRMLESASC